VAIKIDEETLQAKSKGDKKYPMTFQKTNTAVVVAFGTDGSNAGSVSIAVNKMATYLKDNNY
jgi:hypothetical protein